MINKKKSLLILGANSAIVDIVQTVQRMGYYAIVTDYLKDSPAKKIADESWMLSIDDVDGIVQKCKERNVDGVMNFCIDPGQKPYQEICSKLGLPCVAGFEQFNIMTNKDVFKKTCQKYGIDTIQEFNIDYKSPHLSDLCFPVIFKPVDGRASKGLKISYGNETIKSDLEYSLSFSKTKKVVCEKLMKGYPEVQIKYLAVDGHFFITSISDWDTCYLKDGTRVYVDCIVYPSKYSSEYINSCNDKVVNMLSSIGIKNGAIALTAFYDNGKFRFFDPALRMGGAQDWRIVRDVSGIDISECLANYAITGSMGNIEHIKKIDKAFLKKYSCQLYVDVFAGEIGFIDGIEESLNIKGVIGIMQSHNVGDEIKGYGTTDNVAIRFFISCETKRQLISAIKQIKSSVVINNIDGNNMIVSDYNLDLLN